jgi:hypothetical protein
MASYFFKFSFPSNMLIAVDLSWPAIDALDGGDPETERLEATSSRITDLENTSMPYLAFI